MNYTSRFGLEFNPFIKLSRDILIETASYDEVKARLDYLTVTKGMGLITGDPGCGKTTIIRNWVKSLNQSAYKIIYLPLSTLTVMESYRQLAQSFNLEPRYKKYENFNMIQEAIRRLSIEKKITPVIIFDEANYISNAFLNDLKILFNFDMDSKDLTVVLLVGQPTIINTLKLKTNDAVRQRIITSYNVEPMSMEESSKYITGKLKAAGSSQEVFTPGAIKAISSYANGNPRIISRTCDLALMAADKLGKNYIDEDMAMMAINEREI